MVHVELGDNDNSYIGHGCTLWFDSVGQQHTSTNDWRQHFNHHKLGCSRRRRNAVRRQSGSQLSHTCYNVDIDPQTLRRDDFGEGDLSLEVWARCKVASTHSATVITSLAPKAGSAFGDTRYTAEYGTAGKLLTKPGSSSSWYFYRLGTLPAYVDSAPGSTAAWTLTLATSFAATTTGVEFAIDHLCVVPTRQRALTPSGKSTSGYPSFMPTTSAITKIVRSDLSGWTKGGSDTTASTFTGYFPDSGLGGQLLEVPPSAFKLFTKASLAVPDDPTMANTDTASQSISVGGWFTPRYFLARGA